ncbi:MAG TPA: hypothetical protein VMY41_14995 [Thermohalobaculum sp.]|nr:hypothetical protein [Thermohalobaculum sp.]
MTDKREPDHWLARPETIRKLWAALIAFLVLLLAAQLAFPNHGHFGLDNTFGFAAWFGFIACVLLVVGAKALAIFLKRPDTYYDD